MTIDDSRLNRLPSYARVEIMRLRQEVEALKARRDQTNEGSDTFADASYQDPGVPLGRGPRITYYETPEAAADGDPIHRYIVHMTQHGDHAWLEVYAGDSLVVKPHSSNVVLIRMERRP